MRILLCSTVEIVRELGAGKVVLEVGQGLERLGWDVAYAGPADLAAAAASAAGGGDHHDRLADALGRLVEARGGDYDVVDFPHEYLPFPRRRFPPRTLLVARSVLLVHHLAAIRIPSPPGVVGRARRAAHDLRRRSWVRRWVRTATASVAAADLVNVSNTHDRDELARHGIDPAKVVVLPFGLTADARAMLAGANGTAPARPPDGGDSGGPVVAFVGTFDYRKGAAEFPQIVRRVCAAVPNARFRLLGTRGLFPTRDAVLREFPADLAGRVDVRPAFAAGDLPGLLAGCAAGVFPSHMEGFGFGVLEMLAAGLPVVAYDAPGPPMMLPGEYLVPRGDAAALAAKVVGLLADPPRLASARAWATRRAADFCWDRIAADTADVYERRLRDVRANPTVRA